MKEILGQNWQTTRNQSQVKRIELDMDPIKEEDLLNAGRHSRSLLSAKSNDQLRQKVF
jgi:hypothetical protein